MAVEIRFTVVLLTVLRIVPVGQSSMLDGNGFLGSDGWMPGDYGALESSWNLEGNWSPDGTLFDPPCAEAAVGTMY
ncbi:hypothetical protein GUITHDRAFT_101815 [Guillardia theta CCMP2712]|uniref:Alpha-carbonic anhydrase domain-containing protein n=1 Tax=Guillardia theta (strain CCMP2712) TaxID=905079 RepID=L1JWE1_GUITC|nr:hypothetical protein GUITHDRAFT_101815 [Guillardia theta CCMP2712]EKX52654.1 hypothetical protein GUITHDRAFT_101815 [Guillardia theta CCMP2712]|eukprot:XP_005839634.1 hypothetical protein GUITHDRAFT_101815 [Guillardia theta CCMP2712]